ncbi:NDP-sugar synthase [Candidatus Pelagibacter sp.]|nr:NDP-sugar synthase [Candidatus Pelagibacter sp.]|tara:strand:- start:613 stop:1386 length:774 start_codon:yes stop_codon:yes gene_type:complete
MKKKVVAVVLCGGMGSRLSEITKKTPKSLISVFGKTIIWYVVSLLIKNNIREIIFPLGYKGSLIKKLILKDFNKKNNNFIFVNTGKKTEINDRIKKISKYLKGYDDFLLINSDTILDFNIKSFINFHKKNNFLISLSGVKMTSTWGTIVKKENNNIVKKFILNSKIESYKIKKFSKYDSYRNTGISLISTKCLKFINTISNNNFEILLYNKYLKNNKVGSKIFNGLWHPIETLKDLILIKDNKKLNNKIKAFKNKIK